MSILIHVARQGVVLGKYPQPQLVSLLASGQVLHTDHYWIKGMPGWQVIGTNFDQAEGGSAPLNSSPTMAARRPPAIPPSIPPALPAGRLPGGVPKALYLTPMFFFGAIFVLILLLQGYAYVTLKAPLAKALGSDSRNRSIDASAYYRYNIPFGSVVLNIDDIGSDTKNVDMMRVMLQFAQSQKHSNHDWLILSCRGKEKFMIRGSHFKTMGVDYGSENPMYTMRTLPENVYRMDGRRAYPVWEGGALGVMAEQRKNFSEFTTEWLR
jgi:hypothetical protein